MSNVENMDMEKVPEHLLSEWDQCFLEFSTNLIPTDEYIEKGTAAVQKVIRALQVNSKFKIDRPIFAGSIGKKTSIMDSDFDCVLFINDEEPRFPDVLDDFEDVLLLGNSPKVENLRSTKFSVQFIVEGGFNVDLLPAANLISAEDRRNKLSDEKLAEAQAKATMKKILEDPKKNSYSYSSSLCEAELYFMRNQNEFAHTLVRLVKYWYKTLYFGDEYVSGAKMLLELVAVVAAQKENDIEKKSLMRAFRRFLDLIKKFKNLRIVFENGKVLSDQDINALKKGTKRLALNPPDYILNNSKKLYFVLDPVNPFNDLSSQWNNEVIGKIQKFADSTSEKFRELFDLSLQIGPPPDLPYPLIFELQPKVLPREPSVALPKFLKGVTRDDGTSMCPTRIIRNEDGLKDRNMQDFLTGFQTYLQIGVCSFVASKQQTTVSKPDVTEKEVSDATGRLIDTTIRGETPSVWVPLNDRHEDYDVTFTVPYQVEGGEKYCVRVSLKW